MPEVLFIILDWRLVNIKSPTKIQFLKDAKSQQIDKINAGNNIVMNSRRKRPKKVQSTMGLQVKLQKTEKEIEKMENTFFVSKITDVCKFSKIMTLNINDQCKKYVCKAVGCHIGAVIESFAETNCAFCFFFFVFLFCVLLRFCEVFFCPSKTHK